MEAPSVTLPSSGGSSGFEVWQVVVPAMTVVLLAVSDVVLAVILFVRWRRRRVSGNFTVKAVHFAAVTPTVDTGSPKYSSVLTSQFHQQHQETRDLPLKHHQGIVDADMELRPMVQEKISEVAVQEPGVPSDECSVVEKQPAVRAHQRPAEYCIVARNLLAAKQELDNDASSLPPAPESPSSLATSKPDSHPIPKFVIIGEKDEVAR